MEVNLEHFTTRIFNWVHGHLWGGDPGRSAADDLAKGFITLALIALGGPAFLFFLGLAAAMLLELLRSAF
jgi:hypothetical protein